jgi:hypothetical protein
MTMVVQEHAIPDAMIARVEEKMREKPFSAGGMSAFADVLCGEEFGPRAARIGVGMRLVDRLIQKHRKSGALKKSGGGGHTRWTWTVPPS